MEIKDITDALKGQFEEMKSTNEEVIAKEIKGLGVAELKEKQDKIDAGMEASEAKMLAVTEANVSLEAKTLELRKELDEMKSAIERSGGSLEGEKVEDLHAKALDFYLHNTDINMSAEQKALATDNDPGAGFLLSPAVTDNMTTFMRETSAMRSYADVLTISAPDYVISLDNDEVSGNWVGEKENRGETSTPIVQTKRIVPYELAAEPKATQRILDDAAINIEQWLANKVSRKFARMENSAFVAGDGVEKPRGFLDYDAGVVTGTSSQELIEQISSGDANFITADALLDMEGGLKDEYIANANFFLKRTSVSAIRKLKDGQGNYLWSPGLDGKTGPTIMGYGYARFDDMPAQAAGALSVAFGDMKEAYQIIDRKGIRVMRDPLTSRGFVKFYTTKRVGGDVKNFEALKLMKVEA